MTKEQADSMLNLLPLTTARVNVSTYYELLDDIPYLTFEYPIAGGGIGSTSIPVNHNAAHLQGLSANLPLATADRLASLAIMVGFFGVNVGS